MSRKIGMLLLAIAASCVLLAIPTRPAEASQPTMTFPPNVTTDANGDFCFDVRVTNNGSWGAVAVKASGDVAISGLSVSPSDGVRIDTGDYYVFHVCGHLTGPHGTVGLRLSYVDENGNLHYQVPPPMCFPGDTGTLQIMHGM